MTRLPQLYLGGARVPFLPGRIRTVANDQFDCLLIKAVRGVANDIGSWLR